MVDTISVEDDGLVKVRVLLTVAGCPLKDTITRDVTAAVSALERCHPGRPRPRRDDLRAARRPARDPPRWPGAARDPVRPGRLADQGLRDRQRQGWRRQVVGHGHLAIALARSGGSASSTPTSTGTRCRRCSASRTAADPGRRPDHAGADAQRRLCDLDRDAQAEARPGRCLGGPMLDRALVQMLSDVYAGPPTCCPRPATGHGDVTVSFPSTCQRQVIVVALTAGGRGRGRGGAGTMASMMHQRVVGGHQRT